MRISDWSSDVCSSDLRTIGSSLAEGFRMQGRCVASASMPPGCGAVQVGQGGGTRRRVHVAVMGAAARAPKPLRQRRNCVSLAVTQIGRAACGERECQYV